MAWGRVLLGTVTTAYAIAQALYFGAVDPVVCVRAASGFILVSRRTPHAIVSVLAILSAWTSGGLGLLGGLGTLVDIIFKSFAALFSIISLVRALGRVLGGACLVGSVAVLVKHLSPLQAVFRADGQWLTLADETFRLRE
eukprot:5782981-Amphidinium_carterae.1